MSASEVRPVHDVLLKIGEEKEEEVASRNFARNNNFSSPLSLLARLGVASQLSFSLHFLFLDHLDDG